MKNTSTKTLFTLAFAFAVLSLSAQTMVTADDGSLIPVATPDNGPHQSISPAAICDSVTTTFAGGNNHRGNMFDINAITTVTITSFDGHPMANTDYEIYYRVGSYLGFETSSAGWTLVGSAIGVVAQPLGTPTPLPIVVNITIPAGQTYAWYISSTNITISQNYTNGTAAGNVYASDANIEFEEGCGLEYPFATPTPFTPRIWNGNIYYCTGTGFGELSISPQNLVAFPNPMVENSTIKMNTTLDNGVVRIFDVVGKEISMISGINASEINVAKNELPSGMYFFTVTDNNNFSGAGKLSVQ